MNKKALMNITDAILLMMLGAFVVSFVYGSMYELKDRITKEDTKKEMERIGEYIVKGITETYLSGRNIDAPHVRIEEELLLPDGLNGYLYKIKLTKEYVEVNCPELNYQVKSYLNIPEGIIVVKDTWAGRIKIIYIKEEETERIELI